MRQEECKKLQDELDAKEEAKKAKELLKQHKAEEKKKVHRKKDWNS